jgi:hydroxyacylglutathione hydrolase
MDGKQRVISIVSKAVNTYIIKGERAIIVDTGLPGWDARILKTMEKNSIKPADVSLIVITHGHHDHYGSAYALKKATGAPVAIGREDAGSLKMAVNPPLIPIGTKGKLMVAASRLLKKPVVQGMEADILLDLEMDLGSYGIKGKVIPTPGHTQGAISVLLDDGSAIIGDLIFGGLLRPKVPGFPFFGYDSEEILKSIQKVLDSHPRIIYVGHGGPFSSQQVRERFFGAT